MNEITVKVTSSKESLIEELNRKGFSKIGTFLLDDDYFIPKSIVLEKMTIREIISQAILVRHITGDNDYNRKIMTYKIKNINDKGEIVSQKAINVDIHDIDQAKTFLDNIGYYKIMNITEEDFVYEKDGLELAIKDIKNGDILIEIEEDSKNKLDTINKLKEKVDSLELPIEPNEYFVKKAEIELQKVLNR